MDESMGREMTSSRNRNICASNEARNDKRYLFFNITSLLGHRRRLFSGVYISPHSSELDEPTSFFTFLRPSFYTLHRLFSLSLYDIVLPSIDICIRCSLHVSWWWRRRRGFVLDDYIGPSIFFFLYIQRICHSNGPFRLYQIYLIDTLLLCKSQKEKKILLRDRNRRIFRSNIRASKLPIYTPRCKIKKKK